MAASSHASILVAGLGPVLPAVFWAAQRQRSRYVAYQSAQALAFQISQTAAILVLSLVGMILLLLLGLIGAIFFPQTPTASALVSVGGLITLALLFTGLAFYLAAGLAGAICCLLGKDFQYPWLGNWIRRRTIVPSEPQMHPEYGFPPRMVDQAKEAEIVEALCHFSAMVPVWGMLVPLAVWGMNFTEKTRLRFQTAQAAMFQAVMVMLVYGFQIGSFILYSVIFIPGILSMKNNIDSALDSAGVLMIMLAILVFLGMLLLSLLALATFQTFALIAGARILKGVDYRYPLLGNWFKKYFTIQYA